MFCVHLARFRVSLQVVYTRRAFFIVVIFYTVFFYDRFFRLSVLRRAMIIIITHLYVRHFSPSHTHSHTRARTHPMNTPPYNNTALDFRRPELANCSLARTCYFQDRYNIIFIEPRQCITRLLPGSTSVITSIGTTIIVPRADVRRSTIDSIYAQTSFYRDARF